MSLKFVTVKEESIIIYYRHGQVHREDGPSMIWDNGHLAWQKYDNTYQVRWTNGNITHYLFPPT